MLLKLISIIKIIFYKIRFNKLIILSLHSFIRPSSSIKIEKGTIVIGKHFHMQSNCKICVLNGGKLIIGEYTSLNYNSIIAVHKEIILGKNVFLGPNVCLYDHDHKFDKNGLKKGFNTDKIIVEDNVWIGAGCIILKGTHIGKNSVIGAGCVVKGSIPSNSIVTNDRTLKIKKLHD